MPEIKSITFTGPKRDVTVSLRRIESNVPVLDVTLHHSPGTTPKKADPTEFVVRTQSQMYRVAEFVQWQAEGYHGTGSEVQSYVSLLPAGNEF